MLGEFSEECCSAAVAPREALPTSTRLSAPLQKTSLKNSSKRKNLRIQGSRRASSIFRPPSVCFAPGPPEVALKYSTPDGHPDHEGLVAHQSRVLSASLASFSTASTCWPVAVIRPGDVRQLESLLGENYRPSLERLRRRAGLAPRRNSLALLLHIRRQAGAEGREPPVKRRGGVCRAADCSGDVFSLEQCSDNASSAGQDPSSSSSEDEEDEDSLGALAQLQAYAAEMEELGGDHGMLGTSVRAQ